MTKEKLETEAVGKENKDEKRERRNNERKR